MYFLEFETPIVYLLKARFGPMPSFTLCPNSGLQTKNGATEAILQQKDFFVK
jgi:hypothetical protein